MKFGVREICDVVLKAKSAVTIGSHTFQKGEPVIYFDTAKTSTMESAATTVYAQGGRGNSRLIAWEGEKTLTFTMEDALLSPQGLAILSGADLIQANGKDVKVIAHTTETSEVKSDDGSTTVSVTLTKTPSPKHPVYLMLLDGNGEMSGVPVLMNTPHDTTITVNPDLGEGVAFTDKTITVTVASSKLLSAGDIVMVDYYAEHASDAMQIDITPDKFAGYYYLEASTLFRRQSDGVDLPAEFIIPKVKIQSNFTFTMASSGDPSSFTFTMDAFPDYTVADPTKKVLASIQVLSADDNYDLTGGVSAAEISYERYQYNDNTDGQYFSIKQLEDGSEGPLTSDDTKIHPAE